MLRAKKQEEPKKQEELKKQEEPDPETKAAEVPEEKEATENNNTAKPRNNTTEEEGDREPPVCFPIRTPSPIARELEEVAHLAMEKYEKCMSTLGLDHDDLRRQVGLMGVVLSKLRVHLDEDTNETRLKETEDDIMLHQKKS